MDHRLLDYEQEFLDSYALFKAAFTSLRETQTGESLGPPSAARWRSSRPPLLVSRHGVNPSRARFCDEARVSCCASLGESRRCGVTKCLKLLHEAERAVSLQATSSVSRETSWASRVSVLAVGANVWPPSAVQQTVAVQQQPLLSLCAAAPAGA